MTDKARELLERVLAGMDRYGDIYPETLEEICAYLADTNPSETINSQEVDRSEPVAWMLISTVGSRHYHMSEQQALKGLQMYGGEVIALYDHPAPQRSFVRLSDEELRDALRTCPHDTVENIRVRWLYAKDFARAIEDALEEKNK